MKSLFFKKGEKDLNDAKKVCKQFGVTLHTLDYVKEYWNNVFEPFINAYESGLTPNPDVDCNKHIKFGPLLNYAVQKKYDFLATGHYANLHYVSKSELLDGDSNIEYSCPMTKSSSPAPQECCGEIILAQSTDLSYDQTYFLSSLTQNNLKRVLFPLGKYKKEQVRVNKYRTIPSPYYLTLQNLVTKH